MNDILQPMLASLVDAPLVDSRLVYEPKYDGIRAIAEIAPRGATVRLWSRLGNEKTQQFPEIAAALGQWARTRRQPLILDGEIVALDQKGEPTGFQNLQGRIHLGGRDSGAPSRSARPRARAPAIDDALRVAFIAFDILRDGATDYRDRPLRARRAALQQVFGATGSSTLRLSRQSAGDGRALKDEALTRGWEGLIAKHADSLYKSGKRSPDWHKLKIVHEQEFVVGGWTDPRQTRTYFGALLLGVYEGRDLVYVGHTGTGFNEKELARVMKLLVPLEIKECPFRNRPKTNERPHWARPELVAQIKFTEWTADAKLRHPVYLGLRDDKRPQEVHREQAAAVRRTTFDVAAAADAGAKTSARTKPAARTTSAAQAAPHAKRAAPDQDRRSKSLERRQPLSASELSAVVDQLNALEKSRKDGLVALPGGDSLKVTNLHKIFWPKQKLTKGDLFRYYVRVAPYVLPAVLDRPLVMKRFPNGVAAEPFYQHRAAEVPAGVRTAVVSVVEQRPQIIGGDLKALLYTTQLAAISQDPWFSRVQHPEYADYSAFDLDPSEGVTFERVLDVARWIRDELDTLGARGVPKTSGSDGLHIYIPLPPGTPHDAGLLYCQIVATIVAQKHPKVATVERAVAARGKRVYIDCLQNILGKTLATAYSARASDYAGVSTPVTWQEIDAGFDRKAFTIETVPARLEKVGDLWAALRKSKGIDLARVTRYTERVAGKRLKGDKS
ncbi:MAG TPA: DNA ligase D [Vicinamibacterales bacterium]|nr:DNA ligase D [Vicinamibacterales bacterium]